MSAGRGDAVAIVGIGCRFPGGVTTPEAFWRLLADERDAIGPMPTGRFDVDRFVHPVPGTPGKMVTAEGGFLEDIDRFDAHFFGLSPREARKVDPQHRLLMEVAYEALEDAGIPPSSLAGKRVGVFVGVWSGEYENVMYRTPTELDFHSITGGGRYAASGRISFALDLRGPALTVDTGCSASLVALHLARQAIANGEADLAIVGAANLVLQPHVNIGYSRSGMLSAGARCRFGDAGAAGYVRSDGAAAVVLKRLDQAEADADPVRGVLLATAVNADGRGSGQLATPSSDAQAELLEAVYERAGIDPSTVPYVEAHGTGTRAGDPVELSALGRVLGRARDAASPLIVGSVKTNIGHTEAAAGMAGLIKTLLALEHRQIPATLHLREPHEGIAWDDLKVEIPRRLRDWPVGAPLVAGVSSFGITGTNAHAVVAAAPARSGATTGGGSGPAVVALSGATPNALIDAATRMRELVARSPELTIADLAYTSTCRRDHHAHRLAVIADSTAEVATALETHIGGESAPQVVAGTAEAEQAPAVAFVFSGQGSQWVGMGRSLLGWAPEFTSVVHRCDVLLREIAGWSLLDVLADDSRERLERVEVIQPALTCMQIAIAAQLRAWGVRPRAVVGHSMGEVAAAHAAGALSLEEALRVVVVRSRLLAEIAGKGAMALIDLDEAEVRSRLAPFGGYVSVAALNGPRSTVVSGDPARVDALLATLEAEDIFCRRVKVDVASHSVQTEPLLGRLREELELLQPVAPAVSFYSTARPGAPLDALLDARYWVDNLRQPVRLLPAVQAMIADGVDTFVEIAPHPVLLSSLADIAADADARIRTLAGLRREEPEARRFLELVARLHVLGVPVDWRAVAPRGASIVRLPAYSWQRERHWLDVWEDWTGNGEAASAGVSRPEQADDVAYVIEWRELAMSRRTAPPGGRWILVADANSGVGDFATRLVAAGAQVSIVADDEELGAEARKAGTLLQAVVDFRPSGARLGDNAGDVEFAAAAAHAYASAAGTVQTLMTAGARPAIGTWLVTAGVHGPGDRTPDIAAAPQAAVWGFVRTVAPDTPELKLGAVDLDSLASSADVLAAVLSDDGGENQLALAGDVVHVARLVRAARQVLGTAARWRTDGTYLITGGLGGVGLHVAEEMVRGGARRLVLAARTPLPPREQWATLPVDHPQAGKVAAVRRLEQMGASIHLASVDIADETALRAFLDRFRSEGWPPILGVMHCAGVIEARDGTWDAFRATMSGKAVGAYNLHRALPELERMVLFSSIASVLPQSNGHYAAANAVLDALAAARAAAGLPTVSVSWGAWAGAGMTTDTQVGRYIRILESHGITGFSQEEGTALFRWAAASPAPHLMVANVDWPTARARLAGRPGETLFTDLIGTEARGAVAVLRTSVLALPEAKRRAALADGIRSIVADVLQLPASSVSPSLAFGKQGLDSLMALEFRNRLEVELSLRLPASLAWNYPTIGVLTDHLLKEIAAEPASVATPEVSAAPTVFVDEERAAVSAVLAGLAEQSEDDVLRQLRQELA